MPRDERKESADALFERLYDALGEEGIDDAERLRESLTESGVDVEGTLERGRALFSNFLKRQKMARARARFERAREAVESFKQEAARSLEDAKAGLAQALSGETTGERYLAYHRKLEAVTDDDLESLNDDAALLEFVQSLDREEGEE